MTAHFIGIDVGTGSARAGVFDESGSLLAATDCGISIWREADDIVEQSSDDIWSAVVTCVRRAVEAAEISAQSVRGLGFDATCSMVVVDQAGNPLPVGPSGDATRNVIVWMDHRATDQANRINDAGHDVLQYVGGKISPEMQIPKLMWLRENMSNTFDAAAHFFDLSDYLSWRATGSTQRSKCTLTCKWTYLAHSHGWDDGFLNSVGLGTLADEMYRRIGEQVLDVGSPVGAGLGEDAALQMGLVAGTPVGASLIDAHAGGVGSLGGRLPTGEPSDPLKQVAAVLGTSSCTMSATRHETIVPGVWGPYWGAMIPGFWLNEGGQSAFGAALDHLTTMHPAANKARQKADELGIPAPEYLEKIAVANAGSVHHAVMRTGGVHLVPEFLGNRAPFADPDATAIMAGLTLNPDLSNLADLYVAGVCGLIYGLSQVLDAQKMQGLEHDTLVLSGGAAKSEMVQRVLADATGFSVAIPEADEPVLLGAAMLGAVASGYYLNLRQTAAKMGAISRVLEPSRGEIAEFHQTKRQIYEKLQICEREIRNSSRILT